MKRLIITFLLMLSVMTSCTQRRATGTSAAESQESQTSMDAFLAFAGHQFVRIYSIRGEVPELVLDSYGEGDGPELDSWFKTFEKGTPIKFSKNCKTASTTNAETEGLSIFDVLAGDMVYVEQNTGSLYICKYEVTQKLWNAVMKENPSNMQGDDLPVEQVSWNDCQTFISKLNELTGKKYRLPSEAEWEYACRGGSWKHNARNCDPSLPNETPQTFSINSLGLRLAL